MVHFHFTALFAHNCCTDIYMQVEYRIFVETTLDITANERSFTKNILLCAGIHQ